MIAAMAFAIPTAEISRHLRPLDLGIVALYLVGITLFGLRFRKSSKGSADKSLKAYFLAGNTIPWWAIALSIVSAETSTLTIISIPGVAFAGDFGFLQIVIGYMLGRIVVAALFLPRYFSGEMMTAYQLIDRRFGKVLHKVTAGLFLLTRAAAEGVRVFAVSIVVGIAIGTKDVLSIAIISALTLLYTFEGGMAAVIWTDVVQMAIYVFGTLVAVWSLGAHIPGGWSTIHAVAGAAGKFHMLNFAFNLTTAYTFWAGVLGGTFLTMASHGTDQLMVQRMLAARNLRESRLALLSSGVVIFIQFALFLLIGAGLYVFYGSPLETRTMTGVWHWNAHVLPVGTTPDRIFPIFIVREMPIGIAGLLVAAILAAAMSNLSAALNSLSSTTVVDFYMGLRPHADDRERGIISKSSTVLWAIVLFVIAVYSLSVGGKGHVVEIGLSIASVAYGCLLGVFLLGTLTKFATETGTAIGMICGFALNLWLWQGAFPMHLGPITVPHIAFTWYVIIGALVTFAIGSLASLIFRKQSRRTLTTAASLLLLFCLSFPKGICVPASAQTPANVPDFTPISNLIDDAIANHHLPGAVVIVGHNGKVVFHQAYGNRKLAGEPGLDGKPSPAEPMTEDTIFDMASLTKDLATATAIMQLYEAGKIASFDDPVEKYLPAFNAAHDATRTKVTLRMLLTHTSGEAPDISLKDPWGLAAPDRAEGFHRALTVPLKDAPGSVFTYSDVNFILLGYLVEKLSGEREDEYVVKHIFKPLGMSHTRYLPLDKAYCKSDHEIVGAALGPIEPGPVNCIIDESPWSLLWNPFQLVPNIAPTTHDDEGNATTNPHFDMLTRGTVHDPTTRRMGGVAGHAGVFSTAHDVSLFASALLEKLIHNTGPFPLKQSTLQLMTTPEQPGHNPGQIAAANAAQQREIAAGDKPAAPGLAPSYPAIKGQNLRGYGWDIDTGFSKPRGAIFPIGSFGHTGFTGTSLWMDPASDTYVILLANAIHPRGNPPISNLRGQVASAAAKALHLDAVADENCLEPCVMDGTAQTLTGIDILEQNHFSELVQAAARHNYRLHYGLLTNQTGLDAHGKRTIDILYNEATKATDNTRLVALFSPEHGIFGRQDSTSISAETDPATGLPVTSLYGAKDSDRRPSHEQLAGLDAVVIDLQDAGVRFYTYETVVGYFLEAAARERTEFHHDLEIIVLDRPDPIGGEQVQGPVSDPGLESYTDYMPLPVRHGLTLGELARYIDGEMHLDAKLTVVPMRFWRRSEYFDDTKLPWTNPSPNLRSLTEATLYPGVALLETTNVSVGRGTATPFEFFGAPWMNAKDVAAALTARKIPGVAFTPTTKAIAEDANHYPFHGQTIPAIQIAVLDRTVFNSPETGVEVLAALHRLYPAQFQLEKSMRLVANQSTLDALKRGDDPRSISASWNGAIDSFRTRSATWLLYQ
jgi:SSS family transporter